MDQFSMQAFIDGLSAQWMRERAETQMTLGKMISRLKEMPPEQLITGLCEPRSYRGYYCDLSFEICNEQKTAAELLAICERCMGQVFEGYKGGEFVMGALTPLWIAEYGRCGVKLIGIKDDGSIETQEDD